MPNKQIEMLIPSIRLASSAGKPIMAQLDVHGIARIGQRSRLQQPRLAQQNGVFTEILFVADAMNTLEWRGDDEQRREGLRRFKRRDPR